MNRMSRMGLSILAAVLLALAPALADFPPQGKDFFPSRAPLSVLINGTTYSLPIAVDPMTVASRSAAHGQGSGTDTGGAAVIIAPECASCDASVADGEFTCRPADFDNNPASRELHTEMLDLSLCGACAVGGCTEICYLAGQSAFDALNLIGQAARYRNTYGEVERLNPGTNPPDDLPAKSFWDVEGVVRITPAPAGTSGLFVLKNEADTILMVDRNVIAFPPTGETYTFENVACGALPKELDDANPALLLCDPANACRINTTSGHTVSAPIPALGTWGFIALVVVLLAAASYFLLRRRVIPAS